MTGVRFILLAALAALLLGGATSGPAPAPDARTEVVVTLYSPPLAYAPRSRARLDAEQRAFRRQLARRLPVARVHWRYRLVANGFAVVLPRSQISNLERLPSVRHVYPGAAYEVQLDRSPQQIGAPAVWGPALETAGQGLKIGIIDTGVDASHPFFDPAGYAMPDGFPKGQSQFTSAKVIVARAFAPRGSLAVGANRAFDGEASSHGTHVAGIAAGNAQTQASAGRVVSGVAPRAYIGNYKVFTRSAADGGDIENAAELVAAVEAAVRDGMDVINLSLGEPEINPRRNIVTRALDAAAAAGVVPVVSAGNEYNEVGAGSVSSPASAARAIAVAAVRTSGSPPVSAHADFSSVGPTPISVRLKPDVAAPGVDILSSVPGGWSSLSGTSMSAPHVAGAAALLLQRHPGWSVADVKSALIATGTRATIGGDGDGEATPAFIGGGVISLRDADRPLVLTNPSTLSFGLLERRGFAVEGAIALRDAGGGTGVWELSVELAQAPRGASVSVGSPTVSVPGELTYEVRVADIAREGVLSGYLTLRRGAVVRRIPFWGRVTSPHLGDHRLLSLPRPGLYEGTTKGRPALVSRYRYPEDPRGIGVTTVLAGPETVYRVRIARRVANFGVVLTRRAPGVRVEPRVVADQDENRLTGVAALPVGRNPYLDDAFHTDVPAAGALYPAPGAYSVVFDSAAANGAGRFAFRFWVNDVKPPTLRLPTRTVNSGMNLTVGATDSGSGVSPDHVFAWVDGRAVGATFRRGVVRIGTAGLLPGRHRLRLQVSDFQETKNTENVAGILPNTTILDTTITIR